MASVGNLTFQIQAQDQATAQITKVQNSLKGLQTQVGTVSTGLQRFQSVLAGLAIGSLVKSAISYADAIADISKATGIATNVVMGFGNAVQANGGNIEAANASLYKFTTIIGDAADGSAKAQAAFSKVGVSLGDLGTLSEQDLLRKTIKGLADIEDISTRNALAMDLLGKGIKGVDIAGLAENFDAAAAKSLKYAAAVEAAAETQDKLDAAMKQVYMSILAAIKPMIDWVNALDANRVNEFIDALVKIAGTAVGMYALGKAIDAVTKAMVLAGTTAATLKAATASMALSVAGITAAFASVSKTGTIFVSQMGYAGKAITAAFATGSVTKVLSEIGTTITTIATKRIPNLIGGLGGIAAGIGGFATGLLRLVPIIGQITLVGMALNEVFKLVFGVDVIDWFLEKLSKVYNAVASFLNLPKWEFVSEEEKKKQEEAVANMKAAADEEQRLLEKARDVKDANEAKRKEIQLISDEFAKQIAQGTEQIKNETALIGLSTEEADILKARTKIQDDLRNKIDEIRKAQAQLTDEQKNGGLDKEYEKQINLLEEMALVEESRAAAAVRQLNARKAAEEYNQTALKRGLEMQGMLRDSYDELAKTGMSQLQQKYYDIDAAARKWAESTIQAIEQQRNAKLDPAEAQKYYDLSRQGVDQLKEAQRQLYEGSRTFSAGWKSAFQQYVDDATNAAKIAESIFNTFTKNLEDQLFNLIKTGKADWADFVQTMQDELLRLSIRGAIGMTMDALGLGDLFGDASQKGTTQSNPLYVFDVSSGRAAPTVGSTGVLGGLVNTVKGWFGGDTQQSTQQNNNQSWLGSAVSSVGNWWDSVTSSVGDLFGGWFAEGGTLPSGKWGIAGENGPELISGPATITPMGGSTNVTYNINAVDAASFKALVAADPSFIHAVAMQGARAVPGRR